MEAIINFTQPNPDFDIKYANQYEFGRESLSNPKNLRGCSWRIKNIDSYKFSEREYLLKLIDKENQKYEYLLPNMVILECFSSDNIVGEFVISKALLDKYYARKAGKYNKIYFYFYQNPRQDYASLDTIFIADEDIPEELKQTSPK